MAASVWNVEVCEPEPNRVPATAHTLAFSMSSADWRCDTIVELCDWSDTIARYETGSVPARIAAGYRALFDFAVTGTAWRYFRTSWRYGLFYLYPIILTLLVKGAGVLVALLPILTGLAPAHLLWSVPIGLALIAVLTVGAIRRLHFLTLMADWSFARDLALGRDPAIRAKIAAHRAIVERALADGEADEIVLAGHSLGVGLSVLALADALRGRDPACPVRVFSVGSSLLKTALHPAAKEQREAVRSLVEDRRLLWVDVQSLSDPLNFYRSSPSVSLGITGGRAPVVKRISLGKLVSDASRRRMKFDPFRRHRQFVYGAEKRHAYAFHMILLGPVPFERFAEAGSVDVAPLAGGTIETLPEVAP